MALSGQARNGGTGCPVPPLVIGRLAFRLPGRGAERSGWLDVLILPDGDLAAAGVSALLG